MVSSKSQVVTLCEVAVALAVHHRAHEFGAVSIVHVHLEASSVSHHMVLAHCIHTYPVVCYLLEPAVHATDSEHALICHLAFQALVVAMGSHLGVAFDFGAALSHSVCIEQVVACYHFDTCVEVVVLVFLDLVADFGLSVVVGTVAKDSAAVFVHSDVVGTDSSVDRRVEASSCCTIAEVVLD